MDYSDFAYPLALAMEAGGCYPSTTICGSGNDINMTLNKHQGICTALCWTAEMVGLVRQYNDASVLMVPGRFVANQGADEVMTKFFSTPFEGGCHQRRTEKIPITG